MKAVLKMILSPVLLLAACGGPAGFQPGTYVNHAESQYSVADDTLVISADYTVTRRTTYYRKDDNQPRHVEKHFNGVWDADKQVLTLAQTGTLLIFRPSANTLVLGNSTYRKL